MIVQLNARVTKKVKKAVDLDARNTFATNDIIVEVALENWFSGHKPEDRERFYKAHHRKPYNRKAA